MDLSGAGGAHIRPSDRPQDTERQYDALAHLEKQHSATSSDQFKFADEDCKRDQADIRPEYQRLIKLARDRRVQWIVVHKVDRFLAKDPHHLFSYLHQLRECGCKLYDAAGKDWTAADIATVITAVVGAEKSKDEQISLSYRVMGGKAARARAGEWRGGPVPLGIEVVCYSRATDTELQWVVKEWNKRVRVYPDSRREQYDGERNTPPFQLETEVLRLAPSKAKVAAAVNVFRRYASEAVSFSALAHQLNSLGFLTSYGGPFDGHHVEHMLSDPIYIGYYAWNRTHQGKSHRLKEGAVVPEFNYEEKVSKNAEKEWVMNGCLFGQLVDQKTW